MDPKQYIDFHEIAGTGKTKVISVDSRSGGYRLGLITWYSNWRQYVLEAEPHVVWNVGCLRDVESYMQELMNERRAAATAKPRVRA